MSMVEEFLLHAFLDHWVCCHMLLLMGRAAAFLRPSAVKV